ncbi:MAG: NFACT family protein [Oscillospiraceae bacterium]|nr:NFACT family protein [Oscillospiraceae bacterium]
MAFDAFYLSAVLAEIRQLGDARVDKIHQPSRDTVILHLKGREARAKLLIAANPAAPRLHLTTASPENPAEPPMFCMLLRKHLSGARLTDISQLPMERCAIFTFDCIDELGDPT